MKKKISPSKQTEELNRAKLEFLSRNPELFKKLKELWERNEKKRDAISTHLASLSEGQINPKLKEAWDFFLSLYPSDEDFEKFLNEVVIPRAANPVWKWVDYVMELSWDDFARKRDAQDPFKLDHDKLKDKVMEMYCRDAKDVFKELMDRNPFPHLLLGVDLMRSKDVILAEVADLISEYQKKLGLDELKKSRLKWLGVVDELLEVWDLYEIAGQQPTSMTFSQISKKIKRPLSTVKSQWYTAYEKIFLEKYDPESKYATEEKRAEADSLCSDCPYAKDGKTPKCYHGKDWHPCSEYLRIAGREKMAFLVEYNDLIYKH